LRIAKALANHIALPLFDPITGNNASTPRTVGELRFMHENCEDQRNSTNWIPLVAMLAIPGCHKKGDAISEVELTSKRPSLFIRNPTQVAFTSTDYL
jgi:hypothetical protein